MKSLKDFKCGWIVPNVDIKKGNFLVRQPSRQVLPYTVLQYFLGKDNFIYSFTVFPGKGVFYIQFTSPRYALKPKLKANKNRSALT